MNPHWMYRTSKGTFRIEQVFRAGSVVCELTCDGKVLNGVYLYADTAAESIVNGEHDFVLGFPCGGLGVPLNLSSWTYVK